ncbi:MAG TPA: DUF6179 domain-containing protein, partial [Clostridia bacterium]|nr:DUF6179 domain-containing protein [Clostridia bacterium]
LETEFCKCFSLRSIIDFLRGYSVKFQFDVTQSPLNLFEILFDQAVFTVLSENSVGLSVSLPGFQSMRNRLSALSSQEIRLEIRRAVEKIVSEFSLGNPRIVKYLRRSRLRLTRRFLSAFNGDNLQLMAVIDGENPNEGKILFEDGERMNDEDFSNLVELASQCSETPEKIQLARGIHSFWDFIDFLESDCLYGEEYIQIFESLGNEELAVLGSFLFEEELRIGPFQLTDRVIDQYHHLTQQDWQTHYLNYIRSLDPTKKSLMEDLINRMILPSNNARDFQ